MATVSVIVPGQSQVGRVITASGPLGARRDQPVGIAGQGGRVVRVLVDAGSWVRAGQVLAVIDRSVQSQQAAQQSAQIAAARADAALAQNNYERALALKDRGFVSKAEIDAKKAARDAANAQVRVAQAQLGATRAADRPAQRRRSDRRPDPRPQRRGRPDRQPGIRRALPARRGRPDGDAGAARAAGPRQRPCRDARAGDADRRRPARSPATSGRSRRSSTRSRASAKSGSRFPIFLDPPRRLCRGTITAGQTTAPLLPQSAVLSDDKGNYVYVINGKNEVERRNIQIGTVNDAGVTSLRGCRGTKRSCYRPAVPQPWPESAPEARLRRSNADELE